MTYLRLIRASDLIAEEQKEGPADWVRFALEQLVSHEVAHPEMWVHADELRAVEGWLFKALFALDAGAK